MTWRMTVGVVALSLLMLAGYAEAQDAGASLVELLQSGELRPGDGVYVTDGAGQRIKGRISDVSSTGLVLIGGQDRWTLASSDVRQIEREDSVANGILIGVGVGAGLGVWSCGDGCYQGAKQVLLYSALGLGIGWGIDAVMRKTLYRAPASARLTVSPVLSTERAGAQMSLRW